VKELALALASRQKREVRMRIDCKHAISQGFNARYTHCFLQDVGKFAMRSSAAAVATNEVRYRSGRGIPEAGIPAPKKVYTHFFISVSPVWTL
jgi:hypothetical protein